MMEIQATLTERALELLNLPDDGVPKLLLDLGCGSGLSGETISEHGHQWIGLDVSRSMLNVANEREAEGDLMEGDMGQGLPLRDGMFDGAISISAVQWLCNAETTAQDPRIRLRNFFGTLYRSLARGARAVLQLYPESTKQIEMITTAGMRAGFSGGLVVDYPNSTRAKKYYLCLMAGAAAPLPMPKGMDGEEDMSEDEEVDVGPNGQVKLGMRAKNKNRGRGQRDLKAAGGISKRHPEAKGRNWIQKKKEQRRAQGHTDVPHDSKYTGRKRKQKGF